MSAETKDSSSNLFHVAVELCSHEGIDREVPFCFDRSMCCLVHYLTHAWTSIEVAALALACDILPRASTPSHMAPVPGLHLQPRMPRRRRTRPLRHDSGIFTTRLWCRPGLRGGFHEETTDEALWEADILPWFRRPLGSDGRYERGGESRVEDGASNDDDWGVSDGGWRNSSGETREEWLGQFMRLRVALAILL